MGQTATNNLRTVALVGHGAAGKTSLAESLLVAAGAISSRGSVEKGSTVCDFDPQEKELGHSLNSALASFSWQGVQVHMVDTPGFPDFAGQAIGALAAVDTALVVINAQNGIELSSERMMRMAAARGVCRMIVINKIDAENVNLPALVASIRERFGRECMLLDLPAKQGSEVVEVLGHDDGDSDFESVAAAHRALIDQIVEEDEDLLARYLEEGVDPSLEELHAPFERALRAGHLVPILFVSARTGAGIPQLLDVLARLAPNPSEGNPPPFYRGEPGGPSEAFQAEPDPQKHVLAHVFKVVSDPFIGKVGVFRVHQGTIRKDSQLFVGDGKRPFKVGHIYRLQGKEYVEVDSLVPGDLGAIAKVEEIEFDCVLHDSHDEDHIHLVPLEFPQPMQGLAVHARRKADEQRLFEILHKLEVEDPCFKVERHPTTNETVIRGIGEMHLRAKLSRLAQQYKLELDTKPPQIAYREAITASAEGHCRHKKQSGGAGQFGEVMLRVEPLERGAGFEFVDSVKGGVIPGVFMAAVEKGVRQALADGVVAGFPVEDLRVVVHDGKSHPVDGKDIAFFTAGRKAAVEAIRAAKPIILEPVVDIEILAPDSMTGDVTGDLSSKRGHLTGTQPRGVGVMAISGEVPLAELEGYQSRLKSLTAGQGSYSIAFSHYAQVPPATQQQLAAQHKVVEED
ncbi:MAG TPA: elongation factor G [Candidatus Accumulibacter phosphatis]|nr:elongation factor G [Accumulibacter sp.]HCN67043.1 elongation factor G [Accumulibacter sp.]HCV12313.1 elongation factor G [Accumulibacter sp.]HRL74281.1 elongation factor G [Candidatus Accumulibacter phosphatis]HRQ93624.1 elongation factor G [Candidatus Accumulibacter phosphatis]